MGAPHAITYWSRTLKEAETRYAIIDLEALAMVEAAWDFDPCLWYAYELGGYDYVLKYKTGASNHVPDLLSRPAGEMPPPVETACPLEQAGVPEEELDLTQMTAAEMREHQLRYHASEDLLDFLEGCQALPGEKQAAALTSFWVEEASCIILEHSLTGVRQVAVSQPPQTRALRNAHCPPNATHPGVHRIIQNLQAAWISADLMDLRGSATGFRYVLSIVDHHTRFLQLVPLTAITPRGPACATLSWWRITPQSNGVVERTNCTVKDALAALSRRAPSQWPTHLPTVCLALNSAIHWAAHMRKVLWFYAKSRETEGPWETAGLVLVYKND
ncbi:uncharacterized protein LOC122267128 [Penaeus japonicus]|uniref:uncharacterized protein LOC122267128 n=1 Tax=Penaeus japonicus TaxID=27405 RepID=UPI001C70E2C2|nr:uncharacterized protein LOC122267128 [Penaeus japonicus]